jgi:hypothetical protein
MGLQIVFNQNLDPSGVNLSSRFTNAVAFVIEAPLISSELEIDCYLQIYIPSILGDIVRNIPLAKVEEQAILLNIANTEIIQAIPAEYLNINYEMALLFVPSSDETTYIYASILTPDCSLCEIDTRLSQLEQQLNLISAALNIPVLSQGQSLSSNDFIQFSSLGVI